MSAIALCACAATVVAAVLAAGGAHRRITRRCCRRPGRQCRIDRGSVGRDHRPDRVEQVQRLSVAGGRDNGGPLAGGVERLSTEWIELRTPGDAVVAADAEDEQAGVRGARVDVPRHQFTAEGRDLRIPRCRRRQLHRRVGGLFVGVALEPDLSPVVLKDHPDLTVRHDRNVDIPGAGQDLAGSCRDTRREEGRGRRQRRSGERIEQRSHKRMCGQAASACPHDLPSSTRFAVRRVERSVGGR